jgi:1,4-dihydroxy-2-naphthoyl-CoA hydrolase
MDSTGADLIQQMPFSGRCGLVIDAATPDLVEGHVSWSPDLCTAGGVIHGGLLMTLADSLGAVNAVLNLPEGSTTSTIESKTNFFRPVRGGTIRATSRPLHVGRRVIVVQTDLRDDDRRLVAQVTQTQAVLPSGPA